MTVNDKISVKDLERAYRALILEDYLRSVTDIELLSYEHLLECDDLIGDRLHIYDILKNERIKRITSKYLIFVGSETNDFIVKTIIGRMSIDDIDYSDKYLQYHEMNPKEVFKKCPILLSVEKLSKFYGFYKNIGYSDEAIIDLILEDNEFELTKVIISDPKIIENKSMLEEHCFKKFLNILYLKAIQNENKKN